jgi:hypothetical protein
MHEILLGDPLKATHSFSLLIAAVLLLTGCNGASTSAKPAAPQSPSITPANESKVPLATTCSALFGEVSDGLATDSARFLVDVEALNEQTAKTAKSFGTRFGRVAAEAKPELAAPLQVIEGIFLDFNQAWVDSGRWEFDPASYNAAKDTIVRICTPEVEALEGSAPKTTPTAPPVTTDEDTFLTAVQSAHPNMKSTDPAKMVSVAKNFCTIYTKGAESGQEGASSKVAQDLITAAAGIEYTQEELQTIHRAGVETFCPQHLEKLG